MGLPMSPVAAPTAVADVVPQEPAWPGQGVLISCRCSIFWLWDC